MNMLHLPEGPCWGPHVGRFWVRDGKAYFPDGDILDLSREGYVFIGRASSHTEDYSKWTPAQIAEYQEQNQDQFQ